MIQTGNYKIQNMMFKTQFADLANGDPADGTEVMGHDEDGTTAGQKHREFFVEVVDPVLGLVTIKNETSGTYVTINERTNRIEGNHQSQELQLSTEGDSEYVTYVIHPYNVNNVWILNEPANWTQITAAPAPPAGTADFQKKYWRFVEQ